VRIQALIFDVGGVFTLPSHDPILEACRELGVDVDPEGIDRAHYAGVHGIDACPVMDWSVYVGAYARALGLPATVALERLQAAFKIPQLWWRRIERSVAGLRELARLGLPMAIVSNSNGTVERSLRELGICQVGAGEGVEVRAIVDSRVVGVEKPDPRIFARALEAVGVDAARCVYVGDSVRFDVGGARAAGLEPVLFDPFDHRRAMPVGCPRIMELRELEGLLDGSTST
jgi:putative hydrolase of the HAD superfamily